MSNGREIGMQGSRDGRWTGYTHDCTIDMSWSRTDAMDRAVGAQ
jgi:hypothetical protein